MKPHFEIKSKIVAITKVSLDKDKSKYAVTLENDIYLEVSNITDLALLQKLCSVGNDLGDKVKITFERE